MTPLMKLCRACGKLKPATFEYFHRHRRYVFQSECKECLNRKNREIYRENREVHQERNRAAYWENQGKKTPLEKLPGVKPKPRKPAETPLELAIVDFLATRRNLASSTLNHYQSTLSSFAESYPAFPPTGWGVTDFIATRGYKQSSKRGKFGHLRAFARWLFKTGRIDKDPLEDVVRPAKEELLPRAPKEIDIQKVFGYLECRVEQRLHLDPLGTYRVTKDLAAFSLMLDSGLRVGEVCGLDLSDIDLEEGSALIRNTKTKRERYVMFGKRTRGNLKLWLKLRAELGTPDRIKALFVSERGGWRRCDTSSFANSLADYCIKAGARHFTPHMLRHACASQSIKNGQDIERLRQQLGHTNIVQTARYFMLPNEGRAKDHLRISPLDHLGRAA